MKINLEEIEDIYKQELKTAEKEFLDGIKNKEDLKELEKSYKNKLNLSRKKYYKLMSKEIKKQKLSAAKKKKSKKKKKKSKTFKAQSGNFELNFFQKLKFKTQLVKFKLGFKIKNFLKEETPSIVLYNYIKAKIKTKRILSRLGDLLSRFAEQIKNTLQKLFETTKDLIKNIYKKIMEFSEKAIVKFSKRKEKSGDEKKKEEEKGET